MTVLVTLATLAIGCGDHSDEEGAHHAAADTAPAAPSALTAEPMGGGAHLTWKDNSTNEAHFMVRRKDGSGTFADVTTVPFDTTQHHDAPLEAGKTYTYVVVAMSGKGEALSEPVDVSMP